MSLGTKLYELRNKAGLSQDALAEKLDVSRQSVSKWETDTSVPELEKLIRLAELFGVTLDQLVLDRPAPAAPENAEVGTAPAEAAPPLPAADASRPMTGARLAGCVILTVVGVASLLGLFLAGFGSLFLTVPLCVPGILCLACKKRPALWAVWSVVLMVQLYLAAATGISPTWIFTYLRYSKQLASELTLRPIVSVSLLLGDLLMIVWTARSFRASPLPRNVKTVSLTAALWLLLLVVLPAASNIVFRSFIKPSTSAGVIVMTPELKREMDLGKLLLYLLSIPRLPLLAAAVTMTVLLLKRQNKGEKI